MRGGPLSQAEQDDRDELDGRQRECWQCGESIPVDRYGLHMRSDCPAVHGAAGYRRSPRSNPPAGSTPEYRRDWLSAAAVDASRPPRGRTATRITASCKQCGQPATLLAGALTRHAECAACAGLREDMP